MLNLHETVTIIFFVFVILVFIWTIIQTGKSINNLEEDDDGFYDKRDKKR